jgi:hypothetical protein
MNSLRTLAIASIAAAASLAASLPAHAGPSLNQPIPAGALIEEFSSWHGAVNGKSVLGGLGSFSGTGTVYREGNGESSLQGANQAAGYFLVPGLSAQPFSATGNWLNFGANQQATLTFATPQSWIGFLWGSVDTHNFIEIVDAGQVVNFRGGNAGLANGQVAGGAGDRFAEQFFAYSGTSITSIKFRATGTAFEVDRLATLSAVPEPGTAALVLAGLAAVGFIARRRAAR